MIKKKLRAVAKRVWKWRQEDPKNGRYHYDDPNVFVYAELNALLTGILKEGGCRPSYTWGVIHGAHLAKMIGIGHISAIEFGVASGNGLISLERTAEKVASALGVRIDVYGFDTGKGLPKPESHVDMPNLYAAGDYSMDSDALQKCLNKAQLILGLVQDTVPRFIESNPAPVAFISIDLDFYSSTMHAFKLLEAHQRFLLPRVHCYFDDIMALTCGDCVGERLAISEFNVSHDVRKISRIYGLRHCLPPRLADQIWVEMFYMAHIFDHDLYGAYDGLVKGRDTDLKPK
jgi:hypothetical protein